MSATPPKATETPKNETNPWGPNGKYSTIAQLMMKSMAASQPQALGQAMPIAPMQQPAFGVPMQGGMPQQGGMQPQYKNLDRMQMGLLGGRR